MAFTPQEENYLKTLAQRGMLELDIERKIKALDVLRADLYTQNKTKNEVDLATDSSEDEIKNLQKGL